MDIRKNGKLEARFLPELEKQMILFMRHSGWSVAQLVHWLDRSFAHPDLVCRGDGNFPDSSCHLFNRDTQFLLDQLTDHRYKLSQAIQRKINDLRVREQRKVFRDISLARMCNALNCDPRSSVSVSSPKFIHTILDMTGDTVSGSTIIRWLENSETKVKNLNVQNS